MECVELKPGAALLKSGSDWRDVCSGGSGGSKGIKRGACPCTMLWGVVAEGE